MTPPYMCPRMWKKIITYTIRYAFSKKISGFDFNVVSEVERMTTIMIHLLFLVFGVILRKIGINKTVNGISTNGIFTKGKKQKHVKNGNKF